MRPALYFRVDASRRSSCGPQPPGPASSSANFHHDRGRRRGRRSRGVTAQRPTARITSVVQGRAAPARGSPSCPCVGSPP